MGVRIEMGLNGKHVIHKTWGIGTIFNRANNMISVYFPDAPDGGKSSNFMIPDAFDQGFLKEWDKETRIALEETITESTCSICGQRAIQTECVDGKYLCNKCKEQCTYICSCCGSRYFRDQIQECFDDINYATVRLCPECAKKETFICKKCGHRRLNSWLVNTKYAPKSERLCKHCVYVCRICGTKVGQEHVAKILGEKDCYCPDCWSNLFENKNEDVLHEDQPSTAKPTAHIANGEILYVYKGQIICRQQKHAVIAATGILCTGFGEEIKIDIQYCTQCKWYILDYTSYQRYRERYGVLIGNIKMFSSGVFKGKMPLEEESTLMLCGYSVSKEKGLSLSERHYILAKIIHNGIMQKTEVISYLEHFIRLNGAKAGNKQALEKWKEDLDFVHKYKMNVQPEVYIAKVEKY